MKISLKAHHLSLLRTVHHLVGSQIQVVQQILQNHQKNRHRRHHHKKRSHERSKERSRSRSKYRSRNKSRSLSRSRSHSRSPVKRHAEKTIKKRDLEEKESSRGNWDNSSENRSNSSNQSNGKEMEQNTGSFNPSAKISLNVFEGKIPEAPPPPTNITKTMIQFGKPGSSAKPGIQMKLMAPKTKTETKPKITVASAFNIDSDDETEEMPAECKMRMRNIGRDTPTSSGPNSFGKTKKGFVDTHKVFERSLREACADVD